MPKMLSIMQFRNTEKIILEFIWRHRYYGLLNNYRPTESLTTYL